MLPTLIQRYNRKPFHFLIQFKIRDKLKIYRLSDATFYDRINTIQQFIKPFTDKKKMSIFEVYGAFNGLVFYVPFNIIKVISR